MCVFINRVDVRASGRGGQGAGVDGQLPSPVFKDP